ncbi:hypothetical protein ACFTAO_27465 [Paenibacillus rhizoplanae]
MVSILLLYILMYALQPLELLLIGRIIVSLGHPSGMMSVAILIFLPISSYTP